jgi:hypothetical protein
MTKSFAVAAILAGLSMTAIAASKAPPPAPSAADEQCYIACVKHTSDGSDCAKTEKVCRHGSGGKSKAKRSGKKKQG